MIDTDETNRIRALLRPLGCRLVDHRCEDIKVKTRHEIDVDLLGPTLHKQQATIKFYAPLGGDVVTALSKLATVMQRRLAKLEDVAGTQTPFAIDGDRTYIDHLTIEEHAVAAFASRTALRRAFVALADRRISTSISLLDDHLTGHGVVDARGCNAHGAHISVRHGDIGNGMALNDTRLILGDPLPDTILSSLVGRKVSQVISGTTFGQYVIRRAEDAGNATYLTLASRRVPVPDALARS